MNENIHPDDLTHQIVWKNSNHDLIIAPLTKPQYMAVLEQIRKTGLHHVVLEEEGYAIPKHDIRIEPISSYQIEKQRRRLGIKKEEKKVETTLHPLILPPSND